MVHSRQEEEAEAADDVSELVDKLKTTTVTEKRREKKLSVAATGANFVNTISNGNSSFSHRTIRQSRDTNLIGTTRKVPKKKVLTSKGHTVKT